MTEGETAKSNALSQIIGELRTQFPDVPEEVVEEHVRRAHAGMAAAPVQDYVNVLIQRQARLSLAAVAGTASAGAAADERSGSA